MLHLGLSVSAGNILLWAFTEIFVVLMTFQATRLLARYLLNLSLTRGKRIPISPTPTLLDTLPYNGDLHPLPQRVKLPITFARLVAIAISVYLGYTLDGTVQEDRGHFPVVAATAVAKMSDDMPTPNDGSEIAAMAKISCLHILDASHLVLYKAYVTDDRILCEDGRATFEENVILEAELRPERETPHRGLDMARMNILAPPRGETDGLTQEPAAVTFSKGGDEVRIVLLKRMEEQRCLFGIWRSIGSGFVKEINIQVNTTCKVRFLEFERLLREKPMHMPPRMSFLHQIIDAVIVREGANSAPRRKKKEDVVATVSNAGVIVGVCTAVVVTGVAVITAVALRCGRVKQDVMSPRGVASLWGSEKYGREGELFIAMEGDKGGKGPFLQGQSVMKIYLGSFDGIASPTSSSEEDGGSARTSIDKRKDDMGSVVSDAITDEE